MSISDPDSTERGATRPRSRPRKTLLWALVAFRITGAIFAVDAVMSTRTAQGAIAWTLGLVAAPVVAVPAYLLFGRSKFEGYVEARRIHQEEFDRLVERARSNMDASVADFETQTPAFDAVQGL